MNTPLPSARAARLRRLAQRWLTAVAAGVVVVTVLCNRWVINSTDAYLYKDWSLLPDNEVGLVLGTSPFQSGGGASRDYHGRIDAAVELYDNRKIRHIIVSGANPDATYNEPRKMWQELTKRGIPAAAITMDFAGFRTLDSIARAQVIFGLSRFTVITQKYHGYRAVFLGKKLGLSVVAYVAPGTEYRHPAREVLARVKAVLDIFLLGTEPKFLGQPETIEVTDAG